MKVYNTRIAPSPTGFIHLGNIRTAYHNWLAARSTGGKFILRIDDTDNNRNDEIYVQKIYDALNWLGIDWDSTFRQSSNFKYWADHAKMLVNCGLARVVEGGAIALNSIPTLPAFWTDKIAGKIAITDKDRQVIDGLILLRSDGTPTYNFSSIMDDMNENINLIIRGTDHISNTPKQLAILYALSEVMESAKEYLNNIEFSHVGLVFEKGAKLSKRSGNSSLDTYRENGTNPDAILNWILRLGWSPFDAEFDKNNPIITKEMAKKNFWSDGSLRNSQASLDMAKLNFYNKKYNNIKK